MTGDFYSKEEKIRSIKPKALDRLKEAWNENPVLVAGVAAALLTAASKFLDALGSYQSKRAYARKYGK